MLKPTLKNTPSSQDVYKRQRHVLVPDLTDDDDSLYKLKDFISSLKTVQKVEVLPYHTMGEVKYEKLGIAYPLKGVKPPAKERVENARKILTI